MKHITAIFAYCKKQLGLSDFVLSTANLSTNCSGDSLHFQNSAQSGRERRQISALLRVWDLGQSCLRGSTVHEAFDRWLRASLVRKDTQPSSCFGVSTSILYCRLFEPVARCAFCWNQSAGHQTCKRVLGFSWRDLARHRFKTEDCHSISLQSEIPQQCWMVRSIRSGNVSHLRGTKSSKSFEIGDSFPWKGWGGLSIYGWRRMSCFTYWARILLETWEQRCWSLAWWEWRRD